MVISRYQLQGKKEFGILESHRHDTKTDVTRKCCCMKVSYLIIPYLVISVVAGKLDGVFVSAGYCLMNGFNLFSMYVSFVPLLILRHLV